METKLSNVLLQLFPSDEHVKKFCRPGAGRESCCYLTSSGRGWGCTKYTSLRRSIDERKSGMNAQGDNCEGLLGVIMEHIPELVGKKVSYRESMPTHVSEGPLKEIKIKGGMLSITWDENGKEDYTTLAVNALGIHVSASEIEFSLAGLGSFGGETSISLD